jgi:acetyl esterase/lipase
LQKPVRKGDGDDLLKRVVTMKMGRWLRAFLGVAAVFGEGFGLDRANIDRYIARYLPETRDETSPCASPLHAGDTANLPSVLVTAGFDVLRDEGEV